MSYFIKYLQFDSAFQPENLLYEDLTDESNLKVGKEIITHNIYILCFYLHNEIQV